MKRRSEAEVLFRRAIAIHERVGKQDGLGITLINLADVLINEKKYDEALGRVSARDHRARGRHGQGLADRRLRTVRHRTLPRRPRQAGGGVAAARARGGDDPAEDQRSEHGRDLRVPARARVVGERRRPRAGAVTRARCARQAREDRRHRRDAGRARRPVPRDSITDRRARCRACPSAGRAACGAGRARARPR